MVNLRYNNDQLHLRDCIILSKALFSPLSIAPMIDWTYQDFRVFMRLLAPHALLYTEMQTVGAIRHNQERALCFHPSEQPLALQLGGADPQGLLECARIAEQAGFAEVNLNLGCPSDRVQSGRFGACMMKEPDLVADCIHAMKQVVSIPVTCKVRIGIDEEDDYAFFSAFANRLVQAGTDKLIVHARKAWLKGLSPKQNRSVPPLHYDYAYRLKQELPDIPVVINGNINSCSEIATHLQHVDGVMVGRLACNNPYELAAIHRFLWVGARLKKRSAIFSDYLFYIQAFAQNTPFSLLIKPALNLAYGLPGAKIWKAILIRSQQEKSIAPLFEAQQWLEAHEEAVSLA